MTDSERNDRTPITYFGMVDGEPTFFDGQRRCSFDPAIHVIINPEDYEGDLKALLEEPWETTKALFSITTRG